MLIRYTAFLIVLLAGVLAANPFASGAGAVPADAVEPLGRRAILVRMVAERRLGAPAEVSEQVGRLTGADIAVLLANPRMLQVAGGMSRTTQAYLIGGLILAGIIALAVASDSAFLSFN